MQLIFLLSGVNIFEFDHRLLTRNASCFLAPTKYTFFFKNYQHFLFRHLPTVHVLQVPHHVLSSERQSLECVTETARILYSLFHCWR
jgi:hypothetical protein